MPNKTIEVKSRSAEVTKARMESSEVEADSLDPIGAFSDMNIQSHEARESARMRMVEKPQVSDSHSHQSGESESALHETEAGECAHAHARTGDTMQSSTKVARSRVSTNANGATPASYTRSRSTRQMKDDTPPSHTHPRSVRQMKDDAGASSAGASTSNHKDSSFDPPLPKDEEKGERERDGCGDGVGAAAAAALSLTDEELASVMHRQPTINLITLGHVAHGKSSLMKSMSGVSTARSRDELARNMTIKLGYCNVKIFRCSMCPRPARYQRFPSAQMETPHCRGCNRADTMQLARHISFVDSPGHQRYMSTMISGTSAVDTAVLLVAADQECPMPQTAEHIAAATLLCPDMLKSMVVLQNKVDLVAHDPVRVLRNKQEIDHFVASTAIPDSAPIIPIVAQQGYGIDAVCEALCNHVPLPRRDLVSPPLASCIRAFDVNKPGCKVDKLKGGVLGCNLARGVLRVGQQVEMRPGFVTRAGTVRPCLAKVTSIQSNENSLDFAIPGGLIAIGTTLDPSLTKADRMVGNLIGAPGTLPHVFKRVKIKLYEILKRVFHASNDGTKNSATAIKYPRARCPKKGDRMLVNCGSMKTTARVCRMHGEILDLELDYPVCADIGTIVALSQTVGGGSKKGPGADGWRFLGSGFVLSFVIIPLEPVN